MCVDVAGEQQQLENPDLEDRRLDARRCRPQVSWLSSVVLPVAKCRGMGGEGSLRYCAAFTEPRVRWSNVNYAVTLAFLGIDIPRGGQVVEQRRGGGARLNCATWLHPD